MKEILTQIVQNQLLHARWLNSLSYLEYRGARKILRSQKTEAIDVTLLQHISEEVKHALFFKKLAMRVGGPEFQKFSDETMLASPVLKSYFFHLDKDGTQAALMQNQELGEKNKYELITWLVEERALKVYREYDKVLKQFESDISIEPVLREEENHLSTVRPIRNLFEDSGSLLQSFESDLFQGLKRELMP